MVAISTIKLSALVNDAFRTLFMRIHQETAGLVEHKRKAAFDDAWNAFELAMDDATKNRRSLRDFDDECDSAWLLLRAQTKASAMHFDEKISNAALQINVILEQFGNVTKLSFETEYAQIRKALNQIAELDKAVLSVARVDDIVEHLREKYEAFIAAQQCENGLRAGYQTGVVKSARNALGEAWGRYASLLEVLADDDENIEMVIGKINQCIAESGIKRSGKSNDDISSHE